MKIDRFGIIDSLFRAYNFAILRNLRNWCGNWTWRDVNIMTLFAYFCRRCRLCRAICQTTLSWPELIQLLHIMQLMFDKTLTCACDISELLQAKRQSSNVKAAKAKTGDTAFPCCCLVQSVGDAPHNATNHLVHSWRPFYCMSVQYTVGGASPALSGRKVYSEHQVLRFIAFCCRCPCQQRRVT